MTNNDRNTKEDKIDFWRNEQLKRKGGDRQATTYHRLAGLADDLGGRFAAEAGQQATTKYPKQESASPWSGGGGDPGVEPSLGYSINDLEATGTAAEIEASLVEAVAPASSSSHSLSNAQAGSPSPACAETASTNPPPPDGLDDVPRRADGWPLSSHAHAPMRRKLV